MGRPIHKIDKEKLKYLVENSNKTISQQSRDLELDRATIYYYRKKLKKAGFDIKVPLQSEVDVLIEELKDELRKNIERGKK